VISADQDGTDISLRLHEGVGHGLRDLGHRIYALPPLWPS
jgi:hypothetical protein